MNTGVSRMPREVASRPLRAAPSRARTSNRSTRRVSPAGRRVSRSAALRSALRRPTARLDHRLDQPLPGAARATLRAHLEADAPLPLGARLVPADDRVQAPREETVLELHQE